MIAITKLLKYNTDGSINLDRSIDAASRYAKSLKPRKFEYKGTEVKAAITLLEKYGYTITKKDKK